jgi:hypothetical protein
VTCRACTGLLSRSAGPARKSPVRWTGMSLCDSGNGYGNHHPLLHLKKKHPLLHSLRPQCLGLPPHQPRPPGRRALSVPRRVTGGGSGLAAGEPGRRATVGRRWHARASGSGMARLRVPPRRAACWPSSLESHLYLLSAAPFRVSCRLQDETSLDCEISMDRSYLT